MNRIGSLAMKITLLLMLVGCGPATGTERAPTEGPTAPPVTVVRTAPTVTAQPTASLVMKAPAAYPLAVSGPYHVGMRQVTPEDGNRGGRRVSITVWYPAMGPADPSGTGPTRDAEPDRSGAPYALLVSSTKMATALAPFLVSYGFTWASVDGIDFYYLMNEEMVDQPLDILFALDRVATTPPNGLEGMIDSMHSGALGYSFDGYNTLAMSGARIDPKYYLAQCPTPDPTTNAILSVYSAFSCGPAMQWNEYAAHAGDAITASKDGLWQPMTDERIRAVMVMAGEGWWLFGERGLAVVDRPTLMIGGTRDPLYPENALIFEHLGTPDKALISFVGKDHDMVLDTEMVARMAHFATAFFAYHLQGRDDYAQYFSKGFVGQHDDLAWGVYQGK